MTTTTSGPVVSRSAAEEAQLFYGPHDGELIPVRRNAAREFPAVIIHAGETFVRFRDNPFDGFGRPAYCYAFPNPKSKTP